MGNRDQTRRAARERLARFAREFFVDGHAEFRSLGVGSIDHDGDGLQLAAEVVLSALQRDLLVLESPVELRLAKELARDRFQAITALIYDGGSDKHAKETLLRLTEGAPLTICMGDVCRIGGIRSRQTVSTMLGEVSFCVKGCRAIFLDVVRTDGGKMWPGLCPDCRNPHKKPPRDQSRALKRRLNAVYQGHGASIYEWSVTIPEGLVDGTPVDRS